MADRSYPDRPFLAVSAAIVKDGRVLLVRRANPPMHGLYTFPGGVVEAGETLEQALFREVDEETALMIRPVGVAGYRDVLIRDKEDRLERHFVIIAFATHWVSGEPKLNEELHDFRWVTPAELKTLNTTEGLGEIADAAFARLAEAK
jgi:ADP-ribose pyrophosphatase YjhB (NUDIX family)